MNIKVYILIIFLFTFIIYKIDAQNKININNNDSLENIDELPLIINNNKKDYFLRFRRKNIYFGSRLSKSNNWVSDSLFQKLDSYSVKGIPNNLITIDKKKNIAYLINGNAPYIRESTFKGIFYSENKNGYWTIPRPLLFGGKKVKNIHSFYMNIQHNMIIVSMKNKKYGYGNYDLYVSFKNEKDKWSKLLNLGPTVNTMGSEIAPYYDYEKKRLYFSSNGHPSNRSYDIMLTEQPYESWKVWNKPEKIKHSINTNLDEICLVEAKGGNYFLIRKNKYNTINLYNIPIESGEHKIYEDLNCKILSDSAKNEIIGLSEDKYFIKFEIASSDLVSDQTELLWFIANKIKEIKRINILLLVAEKTISGNSIGNNRAFRVTQYLSSIGLNSNRIIVKSIKGIEDGVMKIDFCN